MCETTGIGSILTQVEKDAARKRIIHVYANAVRNAAVGADAP